jgi:hypothetical protein
VPTMTWLRQDQPVHSLTYAGEKSLDPYATSNEALS